MWRYYLPSTCLERQMGSSNKYSTVYTDLYFKVPLNLFYGTFWTFSGLPGRCQLIHRLGFYRYFDIWVSDVSKDRRIFVLWFYQTSTIIPRHYSIPFFSIVTYVDVCIMCVRSHVRFSYYGCESLFYSTLYPLRYLSEVVSGNQKQS